MVLLQACWLHTQKLVKYSHRHNSISSGEAGKDAEQLHSTAEVYAVAGTDEAITG